MNHSSFVNASQICAMLFLFISVRCTPSVTTYINDVPVDLRYVDSTYTTLFADTNFLYSDPLVKFSGKRLIYIHGGFLSTSNHLTALMNSKCNINFVDSLSALGWQVIEFDLPNKKPVSDYWEDGGKAYVRAYESKLHQVVKWSEKFLGHADNYFIGGVSFGGLHALYGAEHFPVFKKYFALLPVIKLNASHEFSHYQSVPDFDPAETYTKLKNTDGFLFWNKSDTRVDYRLTHELYVKLKSIGAPIDSLTASSGGHTVPDNLDFLIHFLQR
jgi:pimeloyl-ACP methyl ester carboxylesterase